MKSSIKNTILFVLSLLFGLFFINAGLNKFFNYMPMPEKMPEKLVTAMTGIMAVGWLMPLIGIAEIIGGLLIIFPKTRALGALVIFPVMVGIILTNTVTDTSGLPLTLAFTAVYNPAQCSRASRFPGTTSRLTTFSRSREGAKMCGRTRLAPATTAITVRATSCRMRSA